MGRRIRAVVAAVLGAMALAAAPLPTSAASATSPAGLESRLLALVNSARAAQNLPALTLNPTLSAIARGAPIHVCGAASTFHGRSRDMVERNYFAHQVPACGQYVWPALAEYGVAYTAAGENIGWNNAPVDRSAGDVHTAFMQSPEHRVNVLGDYNQVGIGAWLAPGSWTDGRASYSNVVMYTELFVKGPLRATAPAPRAPVTRSGAAHPLAPRAATPAAPPPVALVAGVSGTHTPDELAAREARSTLTGVVAAGARHPSATSDLLEVLLLAAAMAFVLLAMLRSLLKVTLLGP